MAGIPISDILQGKYDDFLEYCVKVNKKYLNELVTADYVMYRIEYGISREQIKQLRTFVNSHKFAGINDGKINSYVFDINDKRHYAYSKPLTVGNPFAHTRINKPDTNTSDIGRGKINVYGYSEKPLFELFSVSYVPYLHMPIQRLDITVRAYNSLNKGLLKNGTIAPCATVGELLRLSPLELINFKNMGSLSAKEVISALESLLNSKQGRDWEKFYATAPVVSADYKRQASALIHGNLYDTSALNDHEREMFKKFKKAYEIIGKELTLAAINNRRTIADIIEILQNLYGKSFALFDAKMRFGQAVLLLPKGIKDLPIAPFLFAYRNSVAADDCDFNISLNMEATVHDFINIVRSAANNAGDILEHATSFIEWLEVDVKELCNPLRSCFIKMRSNERFVFTKRMQGETLETVGRIIGLTRERARQIETKAIHKMVSAYNEGTKGYDILLLMYALGAGNAVLLFDETKDIIGEFNAEIIWHLVKRKFISCSAYYYSRKFDAVIFGAEPMHNGISSLLNEMPTIIEKSKLPVYIKQLLAKYHVDEQLIFTYLRTLFKQSGKFYYQGKLTLLIMCDYILHALFPYGYKTGNKSDSRLFISHIRTAFGYGKKLTARAIDAKIGIIGVLIDRGKYIHPNFVSINKKIINDIYAFIRNSRRTVFTYIELFDTFSECFYGTNINNRYALQGVLKLCGCPFVMRKDYITKDSALNTASEFEHFIKQNGRIHKNTILKEFNGLSETHIGLFCQRLTNIVVLGDGYYIHCAQLKLNNNDYVNQRKLLKEFCGDIPVSIRTLFDEYMGRFPDFLAANNIISPNNLFGVLKYMFREEFFFSRPYISVNCDHDLTHRGVILRHLSGVRLIEIKHLVNVCNENKIRYVSIRSLMESLEPDFIRVGKTSLMRREHIGADNDKVFEIARQISMAVHNRGGYCASKNINNFDSFPRLNVPWNVYLLEGASALAEDRLTMLSIDTGEIYAPTKVYVGTEYTQEDIKSLTIRLLIKENQVDPFLSKHDILAWLQGQGLCNKRLPKFLETEGHLYYDSDAKFRIC